MGLNLIKINKISLLILIGATVLAIYVSVQRGSQGNTSQQMPAKALKTKIKFRQCLAQETGTCRVVLKNKKYVMGRSWSRGNALAEIRFKSHTVFAAEEFIPLSNSDNGLSVVRGKWLVSDKLRQHFIKKRVPLELIITELGGSKNTHRSPDSAVKKNTVRTLESPYI